MLGSDHSAYISSSAVKNHEKRSSGKKASPFSTKGIRLAYKNGKLLFNQLSQVQKVVVALSLIVLSVLFYAFLSTGLLLLHPSSALEIAVKNELGNFNLVGQGNSLLANNDNAAKNLSRNILAADDNQGLQAAQEKYLVRKLEESYLPDSREQQFVGRPQIFPGVDKNHFHGKIGMKENGEAVWKPQPLLLRMTMEQKREANRGYCFNTRMSQSLELDRDVPDYNGKECKAVDYTTKKLPAADVIIVFHNEDLSALLRSIHSVLNRTPPEYLSSVILVDDCSNRTTHPWLSKDLVDSVAHMPKVYLRQMKERQGLMRARVAGVEWSDSDIVVFLDSHIECARRWIEPLLDEIVRDPKRLVVPKIHTLDADNLAFESNALGVVGFTWSLGQDHPSRPDNGFDPVASPVMAGGLFAVNRVWFNDMGGYDPEMNLYGGEEMEIGFKAWQCGGSIYAVPCSRVGHIFRTDKYWKGQVYKVPMDEIIRNKRRAGIVWMDNYFEIADLAMSELPTSMSIGPLESVKAIREKLKCKSFKWYLDNVYPELYAPDMNGSVFKGCLVNQKTRGCLDSLDSKKSGSIGVYPCHYMHGSQAYMLDTRGSLRSSTSSFMGCVHPNSKKRLEISDSKRLCPSRKEDDRMSDGERWKSDLISNSEIEMKSKNPKTKGDIRKPFLFKYGDKCLTASTDRDGSSPLSGSLEVCDEANEYQYWYWD